MVSHLAFALLLQAQPRAALLQRLDSIAAAPVKSGAVAGIAVAVVRGKDTLLMKGYGYADLESQVPVTPQTVFRIGSITKQFTSAAVMQLVEQGKVGRDEPLAKYFPAFPKNAVLVRHLLNHTSGIPSYTDIGPQFGRIARLDLTRDSLIAIVAPLPLMFDPGTHFYYNNTGYFMLGVIVEKVTGKKYGDYLGEQLFTPMGLSGTTYCDTRKLIPKRAQGYDRGPSGLVNAEFLSMELPFAAGSLCSTVGDLVSWTTRLHAGKVVTAASFREMTTPVKLPSGRPMNYGYGLSVDSMAGHRVVSHGGGINGFISALSHFPDDSLTVVVLSNTSPAPSDQVANVLARAVLGLPPATPPADPLDLPMTADDRARYTGNYEMIRPDGSRRPIRVFEQDGKLMVQQGTATSTMQSQGNNAFFARGAGRFTFDVVNGRATGFVVGGGARALEGVRVP